MKKILSAFFKTGTASLLSIFFGVITTKIIAIYTGPSGVGMYSLLRQFLMMGMTVGTLGGQTALIQGISSKRDEGKTSFISSIFYVFLLGIIFVQVSIYFSAPFLAELIFSNQSQDMVLIIRWLCLPISLMVLSIYLASILNGYKAIGRLAIGQVLGSFSSVILVYPFVKLVGSGYTLAFVWLLTASQVALVFYYLYVIHKEKWLACLFCSWPIIYSIHFKHFIGIAGVTLVTGILATGGLLIIRSMIAKHFGLAEAGMFDVAWTISMTYVMLLLGSLTTYYLPSLSELKEENERADLIQKVFRLLVLFSVPVILTLISIKPMIVEMMYSDSFLTSLETIRWMLIGDYFKICAWVLSIPLVAFYNVKVLLWVDVYWWGGFIALAFVAISLFNNTEAIGALFVFQYVIYFIFLLFYTIKKYKLTITRPLLISWISGLLLIIIASWYEWASVKIGYSSIIWPILAVIFLKLSITKEETRQIKSLIIRRRGA